jgi:hypothetical protein
MLDLSPGKHLPYDRRTQSAVGRLVRKTRKDVMGVDGSEGSMNRLAESLSLSKLIERHNDPDDPFHLEEHQPVCLGNGRALQPSVSQHRQLRIQISIGERLRCDVCSLAHSLQRSYIVSRCRLWILYTA